ncbi:acyl-CoA synthetase [Magnetospirillum sp. UT-4]|uniref:acyl-CoA synthetase n=1 Tax=Magnetospirillum sp. UT-4 TaxID=2681467 RepID=UPI0013803F3B|nr:acyl-CoA synthetase [Magnetospirillum sp. UT-4]CAA7625708.1 Acyl-coenzyme A synthetases/AMP-(Fatty) acid ligases [Magnetospirillum sp. UT-4]
MAAKKKSAVAQAQAAAKAKKGGGVGMNKAAVLMILAALVPFSLPTVILLFFTGLPTLGAWASEKGRHKYAWLCVGGLNFAGVIPYLFTLWFGVHTVDEALNMLSDAGVLLWAYGASGFGWLLYMITPPMVASWLSFTTDRRVASLKSAQKKLVEEWGEEVSRKGG